jgi:hypothetical protein
MASAGDDLITQSITFNSSSSISPAGAFALESDGSYLYFNGIVIGTQTLFDGITTDVITGANDGKVVFTSNLVLQEYGGTVNGVVSANQGIQAKGGNIYYNGEQLATATGSTQEISVDTMIPFTPNRGVVDVNSNLNILNISEFTSSNISFSKSLIFDTADSNIGYTNELFLRGAGIVITDNTTTPSLSFLSNSATNSAGSDEGVVKFKVTGDTVDATRIHDIGEIRVSQGTVFDTSGGGSTVNVSLRNAGVNATTGSDPLVDIISISTTPLSGNTVRLGTKSDDFVRVGINGGVYGSNVFQVGTVVGVNSSNVEIGVGSYIHFDDGVKLRSSGTLTKSTVEIGHSSPATSTLVGHQSVSIGEDSYAQAQSVAIGYGTNTTNAHASSTSVGYRAGFNSQDTYGTAVGVTSGYEYQGDSATSMGREAGYSYQGDFATSIGAYAGHTSQGISSVAIGRDAGYSGQDTNSVSIGKCAGKYNQGKESIAIGLCSGESAQSSYATAVGRQAGFMNQGVEASAIGFSAGYTGQSSQAVSVGYKAGYTNQGISSIAIGTQSGYDTQKTMSIAIGFTSGMSNQGTQSVAIGSNAATISQGDAATAIGSNSASISQGDQATAVGSNAAVYSQGSQATSIGYEAGRTSQKAQSLAIGYRSGLIEQNTQSVAIGYEAGYDTQNSQSTAIGYRAGYCYQSSGALAIGNQAGFTSQCHNSIAIGNEAGKTLQSTSSISIGVRSGMTNQSSSAIAIGSDAGSISQQTQSTAIGPSAGMDRQGQNSLAIGFQAGRFQQGQKSLALGSSAGDSNQGANSTAVGSEAGATNQGLACIAIGPGAGKTEQKTQATSIGFAAGNNTQGAGALAIGASAGFNLQGEYSVAIGASAGMVSQSARASAIGFESGMTNQGADATAIGLYAGKESQGAGALAIGASAGMTGQGTNSVAIGPNSGITTQGAGASAIGPNSGMSNQGAGASAIGSNAGAISQGTQAIAIGSNAATARQLTQAVAIGVKAGEFDQGSQAIAIGFEAGAINQNNTTLAIGFAAGKSNQRESSLALGYEAGKTSQNSFSAAIGYQAGFENQNSFSMALGYKSGYTNQSPNALSIGFESGHTSQGISATAIGYQSGYSSQNAFSTSIGYQAGYDRQNTGSISIGYQSGYSLQDANACAIGYQAGYEDQNPGATSIGYRAGHSNQEINAVAIGAESGYQNQGAAAIAIGYRAGYSNQGASSVNISTSGLDTIFPGSIVLNATAIGITSSTAGLYVSPVTISPGTIPAGSKYLAYNDVTNEIFGIDSISFPAETKLVIGDNTGYEYVGGSLQVIEDVGSPASYNTATMMIDHKDENGSSSIVFRSKYAGAYGTGTDYGYIQFTDFGSATGDENSVFEIGMGGDSTGAGSIDRIAIVTPGATLGDAKIEAMSFVHGRVGIRTLPNTTTAVGSVLDVLGNANFRDTISGGEQNASGDFYINTKGAIPTGKLMLNMNGATGGVQVGNGNSGLGQLISGNINVSGIKNAGAALELLSLYYRNSSFHATEGAEYKFDVGSIGTEAAGGGERRLYISFKGTDAATKSNVLTIDGFHTRIGIGVGNPLNSLHVKSDSYPTFSNTNAAGERWSGIRLGPAYLANHDGYCAVIESYNNHANYHADLRFRVSNDDVAFAPERMRITSAGNVGIGTTAPRYNLIVGGAFEQNVSAAIVAGGENSDATLYLGTPYDNNAAPYKTAIIAEGTGGWSRAKLHFCLNDNGASNDVAVATASIPDARMTILSNGNVGIGTTSPVTRLDVDGGMIVRSSGKSGLFIGPDTTNYVELAYVNSSGVGASGVGHPVMGWGVGYVNLYGGGGGTANLSVEGSVYTSMVHAGSSPLQLRSDSGIQMTSSSSSSTQGCKFGLYPTYAYLDASVIQFRSLLLDKIYARFSNGSLNLYANAASEGAEIKLFDASSETTCWSIDNDSGANFRIFRIGTAASLTINPTLYTISIFGDLVSDGPIYGVSGLELRGSASGSSTFELYAADAYLNTDAFYIRNEAKTSSRLALNSAGLNLYTPVNMGYSSNNLYFIKVDAIGSWPWTQIYPNYNIIGRLGTSTGRFAELWVNSIDTNYINTSSDDRLKHNEEDVPDALSIIKKLKLQLYDKTHEMLDADFNGDLDELGLKHHKEFGFIAQDVAKIPEVAFLVSGGGTAEVEIDDEPISTSGIGDPPVEKPKQTKTVDLPFSLNYQGLTNIAIQAIQELSKQVEELRAELAELKAKI